jgi:hypothetical protein
MRKAPIGIRLRKIFFIGLPDKPLKNINRIVSSVYRPVVVIKTLISCS